MIRALAIVALLTSCASERACGRLDPAAVGEFHRSHVLSNGANESSVEGLALGDDDDDAGTGWQVCVELGVAAIQNHPTAQDSDFVPDYCKRIMPREEWVALCGQWVRAAPDGGAP